MHFRKFLFPIFLLAALPGLAQTTHEIDAVTITAGLHPQAETARDVAVISGKTFADLPVHSLDELLRYVPGVEVQARGPMGSQSDIVIRGGTFQQVLVLVDGLRLNDPITGHFNSNIPIAPDEIDRIEILKGAASAIYGAEAVGGVVHVITKTFSGKKATEGSARLSGGQYGLFGAQAGGTIFRKSTTLSGGLLVNRADGAPQRGTTGFFDNTTVSLSLAQQLGENWTFSARTAYDNRDFSAQNFYTTFASDTAREKVQTFWQQASLQYQKGRWNVRLDGGAKILRDEYFFSPSVAPNDNRAALWQGLAVAGVALSAKAHLTLGGQVISGNMESNDRGNHQLGQGGVFALYSHRLWERLLVEPALRLTFPQRETALLVPQLAVAWNGKGYQIFGSIGTSLREPDFTERFNNYQKPLVKSGSVGNPDLVAEKGLSYELGGTLRAARGLSVSAVAFRREQQNLIDFVTTPFAQMPRQENLLPGGSFALARNIASVTTSGLEVNGRFEKTLPNGAFSGGAGLTWLGSEGIGGTPGFYISSHARVLLNGFATFRYRRLSFSATGLYKERQVFTAPAIEAQISPSYFTLGFRAEARVVHGLSLFVQGDNITGAQYSDLLGAPMPGRWWSGGVRLSGGKK